METSDAASSPGSAPVSHGNSAAVTPERAVAPAAAAENLDTAPGRTNTRRLFARRHYFGLEAQALRNGAARALVRMSTQAPHEARIDVQSLSRDFRLDPSASTALLAAFLNGGLVQAAANGRHRPTSVLREYALASVVEPLARARAKVLIGLACELATRVNEDWSRNPFRIKMVAVSGAYMSRKPQIEALSLWLILRRRSRTSTSRWRPLTSRGDGLRQILTSMSGLSSFIEVRVAKDKMKVQRPFSVVFHAAEDPTDTVGPSWDWLRDWRGSLSQRLAIRMPR